MTDALDQDWANLVRRLQNKASTLGAFPGVIEMRVLIIEGRPQFWEAPTVRPLEPKRGDTSRLEDVARESE